MRLDEYNDAVADAWINKAYCEKLEEWEELEYCAYTKINYMTGKAMNHLVPVLIPLDTLDAMEALNDLEIRKTSRSPGT